MGTHSPPSHTGGGAPSPIFGPFLLWPNGCMDQNATWYGGRPRVGLRDIVFDVDPATPRKMAHPPPPNFCPCLLWPNGWMDEDAAWYGSRPRLRPHCTRRGPSSRERSTAAPPSFRLMSIVATVAHLNYCLALVTKHMYTSTEK